MFHTTNAIVFGTTPVVLYAWGYHISSSLGDTMTEEVKRRASSVERKGGEHKDSDSVAIDVPEGVQARGGALSSAAVSVGSLAAGALSRSQHLLATVVFSLLYLPSDVGLPCATRALIGHPSLPTTHRSARSRGRTPRAKRVQTRSDCV